MSMHIARTGDSLTNESFCIVKKHSLFPEGWGGLGANIGTARISSVYACSASQGRCVVEVGTCRLLVNWQFLVGGAQTPAGK